jgi:hypothetical protein
MVKALARHSAGRIITPMVFRLYIDPSPMAYSTRRSAVTTPPRTVVVIHTSSRSRHPNLEDPQMAKVRRKRHTYTVAQRTSILAAARKESLTALQVQKKFGVTPVTYYSWRKKSGLTQGRGRSVVVAGGPGADLTQQVRSEVRAKVRQILPVIVRTEVSGYLNALFGGRRGRPHKV